MVFLKLLFYHPYTFRVEILTDSWTTPKSLAHAIEIEVLQGARLNLNGFSYHGFSRFSRHFEDQRYRMFYGKNHRHYCDLNANQVCYAFRYVLSYFPRGQQQSKMVSKISRSQDFIEISGFLWDFNIS